MRPNYALRPVWSDPGGVFYTREPVMRCRPFPQSATRIERGCIVSTRCGLAVVVRRQGNRVVLVQIVKGPLPRHRADIHPSWLGTLQMGLKQGDVVRCVPGVVDLHRLHPMQATAPDVLLQRIDKAVTRELRIRQTEDAGRTVYGRLK